LTHGAESIISPNSLTPLRTAKIVFRKFEGDNETRGLPSLLERTKGRCRGEKGRMMFSEVKMNYWFPHETCSAAVEQDDAEQAAPAIHSLQ